MPVLHTAPSLPRFPFARPAYAIQESPILLPLPQIKAIRWEGGLGIGIVRVGGRAGVTPAQIALGLRPICWEKNKLSGIEKEPKSALHREDPESQRTSVRLEARNLVEPCKREVRVICPGPSSGCKSVDDENRLEVDVCRPESPMDRREPLEKVEVEGGYKYGITYRGSTTRERRVAGRWIVSTHATHLVWISRPWIKQEPPAVGGLKVGGAGILDKTTYLVNEGKG
ncbi:hypothetical protein B0H11DRAFT_1899111 [Mycena galericulata]|nr:hypothetical protein B0H11DRAFT_1899111 [Mycena galericulata]